MASSYSPGITRDSLSLFFDAANPKSYPGSGTTWYNLSDPTRNAVMYNGMAYESTDLGRMTFDGTNNFAQSDAPILTTHTCEAWFRPSGTPAAGFHAVYQKEGGYSGGPVYGLRVEQNQGRAYGGICYSAASADQNYLYTTTTLPDNNWYHIATTFDSSYNWKIYLNGVQEASTTLTANPYQISSVFRIGLGDSRYANGQISIARTYSRALTADEVLRNFNATRSRYGI